MKECNILLTEGEKGVSQNEVNDEAISKQEVEYTEL